MAQNESLISRILSSIFFRQATGKAGRYAKNSKSLFELLQGVLRKSRSLDDKDGILDKINLLVRMVKSFATGTYKQVPWKSITRIIAVLIYFLSPIDLIPDLLPIVGMADDIALVLWLFNAVGDDLEAFRQWEKERNTIQIG
jgi:uncharacterized membrane protein YkvA (DUF1232 family)